MSDHHESVTYSFSDEALLTYLGIQREPIHNLLEYSPRVCNLLALAVNQFVHNLDHTQLIPNKLRLLGDILILDCLSRGSRVSPILRLNYHPHNCILACMSLTVEFVNNSHAFPLIKP